MNKVPSMLHMFLCLTLLNSKCITNSHITFCSFVFFFFFKNGSSSSSSLSSICLRASCRLKKNKKQRLKSDEWCQCVKTFANFNCVTFSWYAVHNNTFKFMHYLQKLKWSINVTFKENKHSRFFIYVKRLHGVRFKSPPLWAPF